jgi:hypothetical protein
VPAAPAGRSGGPIAGPPAGTGAPSNQHNHRLGGTHHENRTDRRRFRLRRRPGPRRYRPPASGLFSPFDNASATVAFVGSNAGYTGELAWISSVDNRSGLFVFNNKQSFAGESFTLPGLFAKGEEVLFRYEVIRGGLDAFASDTDRAQFRFTAISETEYLVGVEDIRLPKGDADYNDVEFRVSFAPVPTPGSLALLGLGGLFIRRKR